ncbi:MAG: class I SAM-dependent methyltransferase [Candidatus Helarchaeota archaeon]
MDNEKVWENIHAQRAWGRYPNEELVKFIGREFFKLPMADRKKIKICELGVGQGANSWFLMREGFDTFGIDISRSALKKFRERLKEENLDVNDFENRFKLGDIKKIPFEDNKFNVVIDIATVWCVSYLEHSKVYGEVYRILQENGLFFTWHILENSWGDNKNYSIDKNTVGNVEEGPLSNQGVVYFAKYEDLVSLLEKNKFQVIDKIFLERTYQNMEKSLKFAIIISKMEMSS